MCLTIPTLRMTAFDCEKWQFIRLLSSIERVSERGKQKAKAKCVSDGEEEGKEMGFD